MRETLKTWLAGVPATFVPATDASQALAAVQQQQADIALVPRAYGDPLVASGSLPDVVGSRASLNLQSYAFAVAPGNDALRQRLQAGLDALERSGRLESLRVQWLSSHREVAERLQLERGLADEKSRLRNVAVVSAGALLLMGWGLWQRTRRLSAERSRRHTAEQALQRAEELLERTFTHHPEPLLLVDRTQGRGSGIVRDANAALLSLLGVSAPSLIGRPLADQSSHIDAAALEHLVHSLDSEGVLDAVPLRLTRADGTVRDCLVSAEALKIGEGLQVFCMLRDITEQLAHDAEMRRGYDALQAELAQLRSQLDAARAAQREAENLSDDLTRSIAQELRAPLHAVEGFVGLLRERLRAGHVDEALAYSAHIERAARRMSAMMAALSSLSQVARQPLRRRPVDMQRLVRDTWSQIAASQPTRQVDSRLMELPAIDADPDLIAQVWKQLLGNAWKFTARVSDAKVLGGQPARRARHLVPRDRQRCGLRHESGRATFPSVPATSCFQPVRRHRHGPESGAAHRRTPRWRGAPAKRTRRRHDRRVHARSGTTTALSHRAHHRRSASGSRKAPDCVSATWEQARPIHLENAGSGAICESHRRPS